MAMVNVPQKILWKMSKDHFKPCQMETHLQLSLGSSSHRSKCTENINPFFSRLSPEKKNITAVATNFHYSGCKGSKTGGEAIYLKKIISTAPRSEGKE